MQWKLPLVEELIKGRDDLVHAAHIRIGKHRTTHPIVKLYPLEVSSSDGMHSQRFSNIATNDTRDSQSTVDEASVKPDTPTDQCVRRKAASKASENISEQC